MHLFNIPAEVRRSIFEKSRNLQRRHVIEEMLRNNRIVIEKRDDSGRKERKPEWIFSVILRIRSTDKVMILKRYTKFTDTVEVCTKKDDRDTPAILQKFSSGNSLSCFSTIRAVYNVNWYPENADGHFGLIPIMEQPFFVKVDGIYFKNRNMSLKR